MRSRPDIVALIALGAVFAAGWLLVAPWSNVPVIDDWAYAWSVEHLLDTGQLAINDRSSVYPIVHILWGALFARVFGFSFGALRLSTVVVATAGCCAIYLTLRELALDAAVSLLAALTVALYPAFFVLSFTFMTDVPFVSLSAVAIYFYLSAVTRDRPARVWLGTLFAVLAFLVRQVGIVLPLAPLVALSRDMLSRSRRRTLVPLAAGVAIVGALWIALPLVFGRLPVIDARSDGLRFLTAMSLSEYAQSNVELLWIVAFPLAPVLICQFTRVRRAAALVALSLALLAAVKVTMGWIPEPLSNGQTWSLQDLAMRTDLIDGGAPSSALVTRLSRVFAIAGAALVAALVVAFGGLRRTEWRAGRVLLAAGLLHLAVINALWVYYDRYYLILIPVLLYVAAAPLQDGRLRRWPAALLLPIWGFISVTGTRDVLTTGAAAAAMVRGLEAEGVRPFDIDAGYALNAWRLYVHPEHLPPGADPHADVPWVSTDASRPYRVVTIPPKGYDIVRDEKLPAARWQATDRVYVVRQRP